MTDLSPQTQAVLNAANRKIWYRNDDIAAALREVINQLQQSPGIISCADLLELCDELENL